MSKAAANKAQVYSIEAFQNSLALSSTAMLSLLKSGKLPLQLSKRNQIEILIDKVELEALVASLVNLRKESIIENQALIIEQIGSILTSEFEQVMTLAMSQLQSDAKQDKDGNGDNNGED